MIAEEDMVAAYSAATVAELDILAALLFLEGWDRLLDLDLDFRKRERRKERIGVPARHSV